MRSMTLNQLYSETIMWFNEVFGTALEDLPEGEIGVGSRCVLANALKQNINTTIEWSVGLTSISPILSQNISDVYSDDRNFTIPVTLGSECMSIHNKQWKSEPALHFDYSVREKPSEPIEFPDYVTRFIEAFDWQMYPHLKDTQSKTIDWYADNNPGNIPHSGKINILDAPERGKHTMSECTKYDHFKNHKHCNQSDEL